MPILNDLECCLDHTLVRVMRPEERADCGPCIWSSGIVVEDRTLEEVANSTANAVEMPFLKPIELRDPTPSVKCVNSQTGVNQNGIAPNSSCDCIRARCESSIRAVKQFAGECWEEPDLASLCSRINMPIEDFIIDHVQNEAWVRFYERQILYMLDAITADNIENHNSDMVVNAIDNPVPTIDGSAETTMFNANVHIEAEASHLCCSPMADGIIMHCDIFNRNLKRAENNSCCVEVFESERLFRSPLLMNKNRGRVTQTTYQGVPVYLCDNPLLVDRTDPQNPIYKTYYFGSGMFHWAAGDVSLRGVRPFEVDRDPCTNGKMGVTKWFSRQSWVLHPLGYDNLWDPRECAAATGIPEADYTAMTMQDAINPIFFDRKFERNNIPLTIVLTNG